MRKEREIAEERVRRKEEKEERAKQKEIEAQQLEVQQLEETYKTLRESMNERCRARKEENIRSKHRLWMQCRTHLQALGSDRYFGPK